MPSLISATEKAELQTVFDDIFSTFSRSIVIYKEPIKTPIAGPTSSMTFGFGDSQNIDAFTYTEVSGVFPATIRYPKEMGDDNNTDTNSYIPNGCVNIKVERDCRDFILDGKVEKFCFDDSTFVLDSEPQKQMFLDSEFFVFRLKHTK